MPTPIVSDGRESLPSDLTGVEAQKEFTTDYQWRVQIGQSMKTSSLTLCPPDLPGRAKAARGPSRSLGPTLYNYARLSQACSYSSDSRMGSLPELPSGRAGATIICKIQPLGGWEQARARGLGRAYAVAPGRWLEGAAAAITS
eukprot:1073754-Pleurochrysis_carterae.AAC.1